MNLTDRNIRALAGVLFGAAALVPATVLQTATANAASNTDPIVCSEWMIDDQGNYVCGPPEDECPAVVAVCDEVTDCRDHHGCKPDPDPDPDPDPQRSPAPAPAVVVRPSFTG